jgi:hypothetical protein
MSWVTVIVFIALLPFGLHGEESQHAKPRRITERHFNAQFQAIFGASYMTATDKDAIHCLSHALATDRRG